MNMHLWCNDIQPEQLSLLDQIKAAGYDGIEFFLGSPDRKSYEILGEHARDIGLQLITVVGASPEYNAISPEASVRATALEWIKERITDTAAAGSTNLGGPYHAPFKHFSGQPVTADEVSYCVEFLQEAGEFAKQYDVTLTPEFLNRYEAYFGNTMSQLASLLAQVDHSHVRGMFDTYHANIEEKSQTQAIKDIAPFLTHVHISENDRGTPGRGQIDFDEVFQALKEVNFHGTIAIEAFDRQNEDFANAINVWRNFSPSQEILTEGLSLVQSGVATLQGAS